MRLLRNPVAQFLLLSVLTMLGILLGLNQVAEELAQEEAVAEALTTTEVLASSVARPEITPALVEGRPGGVDRFRSSVQKNLLVEEPNALRVNLWRADGQLLYTNRKGLSGTPFELDRGQRRVLDSQGSGYQVADSGDPGYPRVGSDEQLVRVYTAVPWQDESLLFEAYFALEPIDERREAILTPFQWLILGALAVLLVVVTPILYILTRRLTRASEERARLLDSAVDASDAERRRIARDLHDGVVQDIAGTTYSLTAVARDPAVPVPVRQTLDTAGDSLRDSLRALRSLLAEIHPPDLDANGLAPALNDLVAPATNAGIEASVSVGGVDDASDAAVALVWRVAQEAVRNALRHSSASTVAVTVRGPDGRLELEVVDDGVGFDPEVTKADRYGLKGLRSLVKDIGGEIDVVSAPGEGTTVRMEVAKR